MTSSIDWLLRRWEEIAEHTFMVCNGEQYSYGWLTERVRFWESRLKNSIEQGTIVALSGDYTPQVVAALIALIRQGAIIVPLSPSVDAQAAEFVDVSEAQVVLTPDENPARLMKRLDRQPSNEVSLALIREKQPGLVLFSSGTTGRNKAALHNLSLLLEKFKKPRRAMVTLAFLMIDHIGGINTLFSVLSSGGTVVTTAERNPDRVCEVIETCGVELLPTSPTFLNLLLISESYRRYDLSSLKLITYGTEPMPQSTLDSLRRAVPGVPVQQTYGLSELGILRSKSEGLDSLWVQIGGEGYETKIQEGTLRIRARSAMIGYLNAPSPFDSEGWFDTQDIVETKGRFVRFLGRRSEIVNVGGRKVYPAEVEDVLLQMPNVKDATVEGEDHPITGQIVLARINLSSLEEPAEFRKRLRAFCRARLESFKVPARIVLVSQEQFSGRYKKLRRPRPVCVRATS